MEKLALKGGWVLPVSSPPIRNGSVIIEGEDIVYVGENKKIPSGTQSLGGNDIILIPGLVNAHTHLELTSMEGKIGKGLPFKEWIEEVGKYRRGMSETDIADSVRRGGEMLLHNGVTTVGDFSSTGISGDLFEELGLRGVEFSELLAFKEEDADTALKSATERRETRNNRKIGMGIAPHAPYSVSPTLLKESRDYALENNLPFSIHIAETEEEERFIKNGDGPLRKLLEELEKWEESWDIPKTSPVQFIEQLGILEGTIGVHLNLIDEADIDILKKRGVSVVYSPGSNLWFGRKKVSPVEKLLEAGINVALGTDGLSSNSTLSVLEEMRLLKEQFPAIEDEDILRMGTVNGATTLGFKDIGLIKKGFKGDIVGIKIYGKQNSPYAFLSNTNSVVEFVIIGEKIVYKKH